MKKFILILILIALASFTQGGSLYALEDLHEAAKKNNVEKAKEFIAKGADVNKSKENDMTPLHITALYDSLEVAVLLLENGAQLLSRNSKGHTPLHIAAYHYHLKVGKLFLEESQKQEIELFVVNAKDKRGLRPIDRTIQAIYRDCQQEEYYACKRNLRYYSPKGMEMLSLLIQYSTPLF